MNRSTSGDFQKGHIPWNAGKKGLQKAWNEGTGKGTITKDGYRRIKVARHFGSTGRSKYDALEHRYLVEQYIGRELFSNENVHHRNGDKLE